MDLITIVTIHIIIVTFQFDNWHSHTTYTKVRVRGKDDLQDDGDVVYAVQLGPVESSDGGIARVNK